MLIPRITIFFLLSIFTISFSNDFLSPKPNTSGNVSEKGLVGRKSNGNNLKLHQREIGKSNTSTSNSFLRPNNRRQNTNGVRPLSINSPVRSVSLPNEDQRSASISNAVLNNTDYRTLISSGLAPQIANEESGKLWATFSHDYDDDGDTDMVIYTSTDDGQSWGYWGYIYSNSGGNLSYPDIEALHDRVLWLYVDDNDNSLRVFYLMYDDSNGLDYGTIYPDTPEGYDTINWGSLLSDKFYYDIENTWVYMTFAVWNSETGEGSIYYMMSEDFGMTWSDLTQMWTEPSDLASSTYFSYRPGLAIAYSTAEPTGPADYIWTTWNYQADVWVSKLNVYDNTVTNTLVMESAADSSQYFGSGTISAYYENIALFSQVRWGVPDDDYPEDYPDIAIAFSYDEGSQWGEDYDWYYWESDAIGDWDYGAVPTFSADGGLGFIYATSYQGGNNNWYEKVKFRTNLTGNFLNGWSPYTLVDDTEGELWYGGAVIQNQNFSLIYDGHYDDGSSYIYFDSFEIGQILLGTVSGVVTNAINNNPVQNALVTIAGEFSAYTDALGNYTITDVPPAVIEANFFAQPLEGDAPLDVQLYNSTSTGGSSIRITKDGFSEYYDNGLIISPDEVVYYNASISPLDDNWLRFVLNWDDSPEDLDIHLITESSHIYYANPGSDDEYPFATLDVDVTDGYGPETITITESSPEVYKLYVYNYSQDPSITTSQAVIQAYSYGAPLFTIDVPSAGNGEYWHVADVNGQTGTYTLVDDILTSAPSFDGGGGSHVIEVLLTTDQYPGETSWAITDYFSGQIIESVGDLTASNSDYSWTVEVPTGAYLFTIYDTYGDGICCAYGNGTYSIYGDGNLITTNNNFNSAEASVYISFDNRGSGGSYTASIANYEEPIPFTKGTFLSDAFLSAWPMTDHTLIDEGTFGELAPHLEVKPLGTTNRDLIFSWDFGDGYTSSSESPMHTYTSQGSYTVTLSVTDGANTSIFTRENYITVNSEQQNNPPLVVNNIDDFTLDPGDNSNFNLTNVFSDPDGDVLAYNVQNNNPGVVNASISGVTLYVFTTGDGTSQITVTASDPSGASVSDIFNVTVNAGNSDPIVINPIPDVNILVGESLSLNLNSSQVFIDPDGDVLSYSVISSNPGIVTADINGGDLEIDAVEVGVADLVVSANDGNGGTVSTQFSATVSVPGTGSSPPVLSDFPTILLNEDGSSDPLDLDDYVSDSDTQLWDLFWFASVTNSPNLIVQINPTTHTLTVTGLNDWNGQTSFSILVSDGENLALGIIDVTVSPVNDVPTINPISGIVFMEDESTVLPYSEYITDVDDSNLEVTVGGATNTSVSVSNDLLYFSSAQDWFGQESVVMFVSDGESTASTEFTIVVVPVNDPPVASALVSPVNGQSLSSSNIEFVWLAAEDVDPNDQLTYKIHIATDEGVTNVIDQADVNDLSVQIQMTSIGTYYWNVEVTDLEGETASSEVRSFTLDALSSNENINIPTEYALEQNYPNPFNPNTRIAYSIPSGAFVNLTIYDLVGNKIKVLVNEYATPGNYKVNWDASNINNGKVSAGVYVYMLKTGEFVQARKMILLK